MCSSYVFSACISAGTHLLTLDGPNSTDNPNLTFNVKVKTDPKDVMFVINEKREISFRGCLDYEVL